MAKKRKCDFRLPTAVQVNGVPYLERWVIECGCGLTIFGNSKGDAENAWRHHVDENE